MKVRTLYKIYSRCGWLILLTFLMGVSCGKQTVLNFIAVTGFLSFPLYIAAIVFLIAAILGSLFRTDKDKNLVILAVMTVVYLLFFTVSVTGLVEVFPVSDIFFVAVSLFYSLFLVVFSKIKRVEE